MVVTGAPRMLLVLLLPITACASNRSTPSAPVSAAPVHDRAPSAPEERSWAPKVSATSSHYSIEDSSAVVINGDTAKMLPIQSTVVYTVTVSADAGRFRLAAATDSFVTSGAAQRRTAGASKNNRLEFMGALSATGQLSGISGAKPAECSGGVDPLGNRLNELLVQYPSGPLKAGAEWTDSTVTTVCRGKTALTQHVVRSWKLVQLTTWQEHDAAVLERISSVMVSEESGATDHSQVSGSGSSKTTLYVDRTTGVLMTSTGQSQLILNVTTSRGTFVISQSVTTKIQRH